MKTEDNQQLRRVNQCFLGFSANPDSNIQLLTNCCGELMGAAYALYNRLQDGTLCTLAQWNAPPDYSPANGCICHEVIKTGGKAVFVVPDLRLTGYAKTDPNVSAYSLKTYIGVPVSSKNRCIGSLSVVYQINYTPDEEEKKLLQILAIALGVEEERKEEAQALRTSKEELEARVAEKTADLAMVNEQLRIDIAEQKQAEKELIQANTELKIMSEELLQTQEKLVRKEKLAVLGRLAGCVGHELRNPLGVINNAIYYLKMVMTDADESVKEYLDIILHEIDNSQRIINDLLDFARIKPPQIQPVTARKLIHTTLGKCVVPENVTLHTDAPDSLPALKVDPLQIGQVLQNLITNALQAMPEGGSLNIAARPVEGSRFKVRDIKEENIEPGNLNVDLGNDFIEISVEDTGIGISPENMGKLFQPLFTTKPRGIGLGLVVCKNLTEANNGRIAVENRPAGGTTFMVTLPAAEI